MASTLGAPKRLDNGDTSGGTGNFDAGADDLLLGFDGTNTRYDFGG